MNAAIVGLPLSGKTTVFEAVTGLKPQSADLVHERVGVVAVPDARLDVLASMYKPKKYTEATIELVDVPGLTLLDAHGQAEARRHMPTIRQADLLVAIVRDFKNETVPAYRDRVDPSADLTELREEFLFGDLDAVTTRVEKLEKSLGKPTKTHEQEKRELALLQKCRECLENEAPLSAVLTGIDDRKLLASFGFLTEKPLIVLYNVSDDRAADGTASVPEHAVAAFNMSAATEAEIAQLDPADRPAFLEDFGLEEPARERLIRACFDALGYCAFLTAGEDEVRAWAIPKGASAVEAAGKIHSDLARGFIRAEVVAFDDLVEAGDMRTAKSAGKVRQEGKAYLVEDGDILNIKFNV